MVTVDHLEVRAGRFRGDLLARLSLWTFRLPALRDRPEDIAPNLDYELERVSAELGHRASMSKPARDQFLRRPPRMTASCALGRHVHLYRWGGIPGRPPMLPS